MLTCHFFVCLLCMLADLRALLPPCTVTRDRCWSGWRLRLKLGLKLQMMRRAEGVRVMPSSFKLQMEQGAAEGGPNTAPRTRLVAVYGYI